MARKSAGFDISGVDVAIKKLTEVGDFDSWSKDVRKLLAAAARDTASTARGNITQGERPHRLSNKRERGRLVTGGHASRNIVSVSRVNKKENKVWARVGVRHTAFYATAFLELGTSKMPAQPWLAPALEGSKSEFIRGVGDNLRARINRIAKLRQAPGYVPGSITPQGINLSKVSRGRRLGRVR